MHTNKVKNALLLILLFVCLNNAYSQQVLKFSHIKVEDGLSHSWVKTICQDQQGFMWFGTDDGLNRFDGHTISSYFHNSIDEHSLYDSMINTIFKDRRGNLWIGTDLGICQYDRANNQFIRQSQWLIGEVYRFFELTDGRFYLGSLDKGLLLFDPNIGLVDSSILDNISTISCSPDHSIYKI